MSSSEDTVPLTSGEAGDRGDTPSPVPKPPSTLAPGDKEPGIPGKRERGSTERPNPPCPQALPTIKQIPPTPKERFGRGEAQPMASLCDNKSDDISEKVSSTTTASFASAVADLENPSPQDTLDPPKVDESHTAKDERGTRDVPLSSAPAESAPAKESEKSDQSAAVEQVTGGKAVKWDDGDGESPKEERSPLVDDEGQGTVPSSLLSRSSSITSAHVRLNMPRHSIFEFQDLPKFGDTNAPGISQGLTFLVDPYTTPPGSPTDIELEDLAPPPYEELNLPGRLTFVDFTPKCTSEGGILASPSFEGFDVLIDRVNAWLRRRPNLRPQLLETVDYRLSLGDILFGHSVDSKVATISERAPSGSMTINILRMWVIQRTPADPPEPSMIGYLNVVPACLDPGGFCTKPRFDTLETTVDKLNEMLKQRPLPGRVFNLETFQMRFRQYGKWVDPKRCHWRDHNEFSMSNLTVIRLYYTIGTPFMEQILFKDIVPGTYQALYGDVYRLQFENFNGLPSKINNWLRDRTNVSILNIHTVNHKIKDLTSGQCLDTQKTLTTSYRIPNQLQVMRIWYIQLGDIDTDMTPPASPVRYRRASPMMAGASGKMDLLPPPPSPRSRRRRSSARPSRLSSSEDSSGRVISSCVSCKTFVPQPVGKLGMFETPSFETLSHTRKRMEEWLSYNPGVRIISADTSCVMLEPSIEGDQTLPLYYPRSATSGALCWLQVLRIYYEGHSHEIPAGAVQYNFDSDNSQNEESNKSRCTLM